MADGKDTFVPQADDCEYWRREDPRLAFLYFCISDQRFHIGRVCTITLLKSLPVMIESNPEPKKRDILILDVESHLAKWSTFFLDPTKKIGRTIFPLTRRNVRESLNADQARAEFQELAEKVMKENEAIVRQNKTVRFSQEVLVFPELLETNSPSRSTFDVAPNRQAAPTGLEVQPEGRMVRFKTGSIKQSLVFDKSVPAHLVVATLPCEVEINEEEEPGRKRFDFGSATKKLADKLLIAMKSDLVAEQDRLSGLQMLQAEAEQCKGVYEGLERNLVKAKSCQEKRKVLVELSKALERLVIFEGEHEKRDHDLERSSMLVEGMMKLLEVQTEQNMKLMN
jgi:hypothetical protein